MDDVVRKICHLNVLLSSVQNCNSISKREAVKADPTQGLLTYGPIKVDVPETFRSSKPLKLYGCFRDGCTRHVV